MANGLINLQTDLKSLKYSSMPLGSDKPLITKNIGQAPGSQIGAEISHRIDDVSRIAQMLVGKPGIKYLLHEALLQQIGVGQRIKKAQKKGKSLVGAVLQQVGSTLLTTVKIAGSTLIQVPVNGTGTHFLKGFRTDTYLSDGKTHSAFASFFGAGGVEGAQYALNGETVPNTINKEYENFGETSKITGKFNPTPSLYDYNAKVNTDNNEVQNTPIPEWASKEFYNSTLASRGKVIPVSKAEIRPVQATNADTGEATTLPGFNTPFQQGSRVETTATPGADTLIESISNQNFPTSSLGDNGNSGIKTPYNNTKSSSYTGFTTEENIASVLGGNSISTRGPFPLYEIEHDFTSIAEISSASIDNHQSQPNSGVDRIYQSGSTYSQDQQARKIISGSGIDVVKERRVGLGDQGLTSKAGVDYFTPATKLEHDQVNMLDVGGRQDAALAARDMAKFFFEIITPEGSSFLYFRAHIKSMDDSFSADWQARKYTGRAENFYTYGGFDRDVSISFTIAAATRTEMRPLYRKMVYLASATAPTYGTSGLMRGTLARVTIGSYLDEIPGIITSVKYTLVNEAPWEIAMGQPENVETDVQVLPMVMDCSIAFKPIHDFAPQTGLKHYFTNSHAGVKFF